jgi:hypothetical protein
MYALTSSSGKARVELLNRTKRIPAVLLVLAHTGWVHAATSTRAYLTVFVGRDVGFPR